MYLNEFELNVLLCIYTTISQNQFNLNSQIKDIAKKKNNWVIKHE